MRSHLYTEIDMLVRDAKRFPKLAALVERAEHLTDDEIDTADVPLAWYKKALRKLRAKCIEDDRAAAEYQDVYQRVAAGIKNGFAADPLGQIREWRGGDAWIKTGAETSLLMNEGKLIWYPMTGGCWIETVFCAVPDPRLLAESVPLRVGTKSEYTEAFKEAMAARHGIKLYDWLVGDPEKSNGGGMYRLDGRTDGLNIHQHGPTSR